MDAHDGSSRSLGPQWDLIAEITAWPGALQLQIIFYLGTTRTPSTMILEREVFPLLKGFKIPGWIANETFAGEYAESVQAKLNDWCQVQIRRTALQAAYCEALAKLFGCPLERSADSSQISFHFSIASLANFVVVIHFQTGPEFPIQMPNITIQTLMSTRGGKCFRAVYNSYPYSPRWPPEEIAERHRAFLTDTLPAFKGLVTQQSSY